MQSSLKGSERAPLHFSASSREKGSDFGNSDQSSSVCGSLGKFVHLTKSQGFFFLFKNEYNLYTIISPLNRTIQFLIYPQSYATITTI